jgi:predicted permease
MVVAQLTVAVVLLVGAGLFARSLSAVLDQDAGFRTQGILTVDLSTPGPQIRVTSKGLELDDPSTPPRQAQLSERLMSRLGTMPGVNEVGGISRLPLTGSGSNGTFLVVRGDEGNTIADLAALAKDQTRTGTAEFRVVSTSYFRTMGIPLLRGRLFLESDGPDAPHVAVISESLARTRWPNRDPIGLRIQNGGMDGDLRLFTIVGIVGDVRARGLDAAPPSIFYAEYRQRPLSTFDFSFVIQTAVPPDTLIPEARRIIASIAPETPPRFRTMQEVVDATVASRRLTFLVTALFAGAALLLAVLGVYGVLSYLVAQRHHEFGVRLALGAASVDLMRLVLRQAASLTVSGLALGLIASFAASRLVARLLFGITPNDPLTYGGVAAAIGTAALVASQVPVFRATRVDPLVALKHD